jgi:hypothetical protein
MGLGGLEAVQKPDPRRETSPREQTWQEDDCKNEMKSELGLEMFFNFISFKDDS